MSKPLTESNASRRSSWHEPDSQPATRSTGVPVSCRYCLVQGLAYQTLANAAWPMPRPNEGSSRADG